MCALTLEGWRCIIPAIIILYEMFIHAVKALHFLHAPPPVRIFTVLALLVFAVSVMSGGCGSSSSSFIYQSVNTTMNGAWSYESGTVTVNLGGASQELTVQNFSVLFDSCDIEEDTGSARFAAVGVLLGERLLLPTGRPPAQPARTSTLGRRTLSTGSSRLSFRTTTARGSRGHIQLARKQCG